MKIIMVVNDTNFAWNLRREVLSEFSKRGWETVLVAEVISFREELEKIGVRIIDIKIDRRGTNPFSDIKLFHNYMKVFKTERPDLVFTNNTKPNVYAGIACQLLRINYIANITGLGTAVENPGKMQRLSINLYKKGVKKAKTLFFQNSQNQCFFHQHKMIPKKATEVLLPGSGVNLTTHQVLPWPEGPVHFLYAARIMKEKGIDGFLAAAKKYAGPDVFFDVCGQCDDKSYEQLLSQEKCVTYHGLQKDLIPFYAECSCFLYPSYYPEGMSNVLLEAAACGRPIISTDRGGCREPIDDGVNGFIVPIKDDSAVINAVGRFLSMSSHDRRAMGLAGRKKMEKEFDREIVVEKYVCEVEKMM